MLIHTAHLINRDIPVSHPAAYAVPSQLRRLFLVFSSELFENLKLFTQKFLRIHRLSLDFTTVIPVPVELETLGSNCAETRVLDRLFVDHHRTGTVILFGI